MAEFAENIRSPVTNIPGLPCSLLAFILIGTSHILLLSLDGSQVGFRYRHSEEVFWSRFVHPSAGWLLWPAALLFCVRSSLVLLKTRWQVWWVFASFLLSVFSMPLHPHPVLLEEQSGVHWYERIGGDFRASFVSFWQRQHLLQSGCPVDALELHVYLVEQYAIADN